MAELTPEQKAFVLNWAKKHSFYDAWEPALSDYDQALVLGATTGRMQMRLNHLKKLWNEGTRFKEIVWLTGERPLDPRIDKLTDRCLTEAQAAHIIWKETALPEEMRQIPVRFIATPMKGHKRPNTQDTLITWLEKSPATATALFISDQPFCGYQYAVINSSLPDSLQFDVAAVGADPTSHPSAAAITLDSIARWIYQESLISE